MAEDAGTGNEGGAPTKPDGLPDKFWDGEKGEVRVDAMAKSYTELEKTLGSRGKDDDKQGLTIPKGQDLPVETVLQNAGLNPDELATQYTTSGTLTDAQYAALRAQGYGRPMVDAYLKAQSAAAQAQTQAQTQITAQAQEMAGGEAQLQTLLQWAAGGLSAAEVESMEARLNSPQLWQGAMTELLARHSAAVGAGKAQPLITGDTSAGGTGPLTKEEFGKLQRAAAAGDATAISRMKGITPGQLSKLYL